MCLKTLTDYLVTTRQSGFLVVRPNNETTEQHKRTELKISQAT